MYMVSISDHTSEYIWYFTIDALRHKHSDRQFIDMIFSNFTESYEGVTVCFVCGLCKLFSWFYPVISQVYLDKFYVHCPIYKQSMLNKDTQMWNIDSSMY